MNQRIKKLRDTSLQAVPHLSGERARLVTEFYRSDESQTMSPPVRRARCLYYILENKKICINDHELIVGERGTAPKATPTYPEICLHSQKDLKILDCRDKVSFKTDEYTRLLYRDVIEPYWKGRSNRDRIINSLPLQWKLAYEAGIFTEFQEQRAPGHTVCGDRIYREGMLDIKKRIFSAIHALDLAHDPDAAGKMEELSAMAIAADAIIMFAERHAGALDQLSAAETDPARKAELAEMAVICRKVPAQKPESFHEALQYYWFVHLGVITELNPWDSFNPGRLDQHLYPFYQKGLSDGSLTKDRAVELLQSFWVKFNNHPAPPKIGVTAEESNTYTDFTLINLGGVNEQGEDAVNELTYIILDVIREMRLLQPGSMVQISRKNPDAFVHKAVGIIASGFGQPSCFNTEALIEEMTWQGKTISDARKGGASGCVETGAFGTECYILTGYFNLPKVLEITLNDGIDPGSGKMIGLKTGAPEEFEDFNMLLQAFQQQLKHFIDIKIEGNNIIDRIFAKELPAPFLSLLIDDCIAKGMDYNEGGARYNTSYIQGVGIASLTDSLTALKYHVFDKKTVSMSRMMDMLKADFKGYESFRYTLLINTPKYGNDNDYADELLKKVFEYYLRTVDGRPTFRDGRYHINLLPTTCHIYFGKVTGALPDGRKSGEPLSEGISPVQGADRQGPTSVFKSAAKIDHLQTGGTLLNQKFSPSFFKSHEGTGKLASLIRAYFRMNGHHVQFNVVSAETLRQAQKEPEKYRDLIVRVAGYSDYFNDLGRDLQDEIIQRTEHERDW
jgi:formate C-acetyltransferase